MEQAQVARSPASTSCVTQPSRRKENPPAVPTETLEDLGNIVAEVANIYNVDRQDSLQARQTRRQNQPLPASTEFISLEDLLRTQPEPAPGQDIVDMILRDFCSSPTYEETEDLPTCESPPWFRFRKKKIKSYKRKRPSAQQEVVTIAIEIDEEEDDRLSCSSGLSVQEDPTAPTATAVCELDANTSQKICENLLNLSEYFSLSNPNRSKDQPQAVNIEINLPTKAIPDTPKPSSSRDERSCLSDTNSSAECTAIELENLESDLLEIGFTFEASEVCDIKPRGDTLFGDSKASTTVVQSQSDSKVCVDWSEGDSLLENYNTEKMSLSDEELEEKPLKQAKTEEIEVKSEVPQSYMQSLLDEIPISEWQTEMDIPEEPIKKLEELTQETVKREPSQNETQETVIASTSKCINDAEFLLEIPLDEWQPMEMPEFVGFRTASDKPIVVTEEMQERAAKLLADVEGQLKYEQVSEIPTASSDSFMGFRTASNKPIEITEEMASKGAMFIAQFQATDQQSQSNEAEFLQGIAFSEWQPMDMSEVTKAEDLSQSINKSLKHLEQPEPQTPNHSQSRNIPQLVAFRKTPYKFMEVAEEMKIKGEQLMAEVESGLYQPSQRKHKPNEVSEELKKQATNIREVVENNTIDKSEFVGFRTASDKAIVVSEEMKIRAAQFMAEFQTGGSNQENELDVHKETDNADIDKPKEMKLRASNLITEVEAAGSNCQQENVPDPAIKEEDFVGFRTASNKAIVVSEEMKKKAATFMAEFQNIYLNPEEHKELDSRQSEQAPESFDFQTASSRAIEISVEKKNKATKLIAESEVVNKDQKPTSDKDCLSDILDNVSGEDFKGFPENGVLPFSADEDLSNDMVFPRLSQTIDSRVCTPKQRRETSDGIPSSKRHRKISNSPEKYPQPNRGHLHKSNSCQDAVLTPSQSQDIHASLTLLAGLSPLDQTTKTSVIARRNLLTLSKRRKRGRTPTGTLAGCASTPLKSRLAALPASTSTPLADKNTNHVQDSTATNQNAEDMSPICMPPSKSRRLGLSRSRY